MISKSNFFKVALSLIVLVLLSSCSALQSAYENKYDEAESLYKEGKKRKAYLKFKQANALYLAGNEKMFLSQLREAELRASVYNNTSAAYEILADLVSQVRRIEDKNIRKKRYAQIRETKRRILTSRKSYIRRYKKLSLRKQKQVYIRAVRARNRGRYLKADLLFAQIEGYKDASKLREKNKASKQMELERMFQNAMKYYNSAKYKKAISAFDTILKYSNHEDAKYYKEKAKRKLELLEES